MRGRLGSRVLLLVGPLVAACAPVSAPPLSLDAGLALPEPERAVIQAARRAVVSIFYDFGGGRGGGRRSGSGFLVEPRLVVTDYHVLWGQPRFLTIVGPDGRLGPRGRLDTVSSSYDLALIVLEQEWRPGQPLQLATYLVPGSKGVALAGRWVPTACSRHTALVQVKTVTSLRASSKELGTGAASSPSEILLLPADQVCMGFSGGPVLNMQGQVIGVVRGAVRGTLSEEGLGKELDVQWVAATSVRHVREALVAFHQQPG